MPSSNRVVVLLSLFAVLAFACLIPLGTWQDDYLNLHQYAQDGVHFFLERLRHWSPRPLSELFIWGYALVVDHFGRPLIGVFLAPFWLLLILAALLPAWLGKRNLLSSSILLAMLLLGHPVAELFYWPDGAAAYLPTLAAALLPLTLDWAGWGDRRAANRWITLGLIVAAASSEVGAMFAIIYSVLMVACRGVEDRRRILMLAVPVALSVSLLYLQYIGRVAQAGEVFGDAAVAHHPWASLLATAKRLPFELLNGNTLSHRYVRLAEGLVIKLLLLAGLYQALSRTATESTPRIQRQRLALVLATIGTATATITAAYYNFGELCCERHDTLRQGYVLIALAALATVLAARCPGRRHSLAAPLLMLALAIPLIHVAPRLLWEYRDYAAIIRARSETWREGQSPRPDMVFTQTQPNLTGNLYLRPGTYRRSADPRTDQRAQWMMVFFDKQSITFTPAVDRKRPANRDD